MELATEPPINHRRHADDLCQSWQGRMLRLTQGTEMGVPVLSMMGHAYDAEVLQVLLCAVFPGFRSISLPFLSSAAKIDKSGRIVADVIDRQERCIKDQPIFRSLGNLKSKCRRLADKMKLTDAERIEFFTIIKRWVVADMRLDPNLDPRDPGARRLVH